MKNLLALLLLVSLPLQAASPEPLRAKQAMVTSSTLLSSQVGTEILRKGGNAVDAAVAVAFALAVTWPQAGNLGGGGFMLLRNKDGAAEAIDYRERAPLAATRTMYLDAEGKVIPRLSTHGHKAVAVPGTVAGLVLAHQRHGSLPWRELVEPARRLAAEGIEVNHHLAQSLRVKSTVDRLANYPEARRIYQRDGRFYEMGERFVQPELAATLARIKNDPRDFYEGETARMLLAEMKANGGVITAEDLRTYKPTIRKPLRGTYRGTEILTMPPPSSGGVALLAMLNMLEPYDLPSMGWHSSQHVHTMVEVMRRAFADRAHFLGDTDFARVPVEALISRAYADERRKTIDPKKASPSRVAGPGNPVPYESPDTTHFTIVDREGNVVSNTYTLNDSYGSALIAKGTGFLLNNEMDDFTVRPGVPNEWQLVQGEPNAIEPRKRPLSSMTPVIVLRDGKVWFAAGSPGGPGIITTLVQVMVNVVDFGMNIQEAVDAPRFHHQWMPDEIFWEAHDLQADTRAALEKMGHKFRAKLGIGEMESIGEAQAVMIDPRTGLRLAGADPRRGGAAAGY